MNLNEYQLEASRTNLHSNTGNLELARLVLGMVEESGECAGKLKKFLRGDFEKDKLIELLAFELGDCLWYISQVASQLNLTLEDVAARNISKLQDRERREVIRGDGDYR